MGKKFIDIYQSDPENSDGTEFSEALQQITKSVLSKEYEVREYFFSYENHLIRAKERNIHTTPSISLPNGVTLTGIQKSTLVEGIVYGLLQSASSHAKNDENSDVYVLNLERNGDVHDQFLLSRALIEYQTNIFQREQSFLFSIFEKPSDIPLDWYDKLSKGNCSIFILSNFDKYPNEGVSEFARFRNNVHLGSIARENMILTLSLTPWKNRAAHVPYARGKFVDERYQLSWSTTVSEGCKVLDRFVLPLFLTSYTVDATGNTTTESNRFVAPVRDAISRVQGILSTKR